MSMKTIAKTTRIAFFSTAVLFGATSSASFAQGMDAMPGMDKTQGMQNMPKAGDKAGMEGMDGMKMPMMGMMPMMMPMMGMGGGASTSMASANGGVDQKIDDLNKKIDLLVEKIGKIESNSAPAAQ